MMWMLIGWGIVLLIIIGLVIKGRGKIMSWITGKKEFPNKYNSTLVVSDEQVLEDRAITCQEMQKVGICESFFETKTGKNRHKQCVCKRKNYNFISMNGTFRRPRWCPMLATNKKVKRISEELNFPM